MIKSDGGAAPRDAVVLSLEQRLDEIERLEKELIREVGAQLQSNSDIYVGDFFVIGAIRRTLAQARGFRSLIEAKNFPCAAGILRMQLDTAMRMNGFRLAPNRESMAKDILDGAKMNSFKDAGGKKFQDAHLRDLLARDHPWITKVYEETSAFVHLSGKHFYNAIQKVDGDTRIIRFAISGDDPARPDDAYFEIVDAFFEATQMASQLLLGYIVSRRMDTAEASKSSA